MFEFKKLSSLFDASKKTSGVQSSNFQLESESILEAKKILHESIQTCQNQFCVFRNAFVGM